MNPIKRLPRVDRRVLLSSFAILPLLSASFRSTSAVAQTQRDPLPSWNEGATKASILDFVARVTTQGGPFFVPVEQRVATFDNDGTLWVEQPTYTQLAFALDRVKVLAPMHPNGRPGNHSQRCLRASRRKRPRSRSGRESPARKWTWWPPSSTRASSGGRAF